MKLEKPKGLLVLWITVFFLFVFFFALSLFLWNGGAFWTAFTQHRPSFSVLAGDETVLAAEEWNTLPPAPRGS